MQLLRRQHGKDIKPNGWRIAMIDGRVTHVTAAIGNGNVPLSYAKVLAL
jgi:hypothetical protein